MQYTHVIWDWNGTLLDDVPWCIYVINTMLRRRGLPTLPDIAAYHRVFGFPVIDYYRRLGFDFAAEPFERLSVEYIGMYHADDARISLHTGAEDTLRILRDAGLRQVILSASEIGNLRMQLQPFNIAHYFDEILGISDIYAAGKLEVGRGFLRRAGAVRFVLIGDSVHDYEVAAALGIDCVLAAIGHQSADTLRACGVPVVQNLGEVSELICGL